jgi:hypothetical protein
VAGKLLCGSCAELFGKFFVPEHTSDIDKVKSAFTAWDRGGDGCIDKVELFLVIKALDPDFSDRDLDRLLRLADKNGSGRIELQDFCDWIEEDEPVAVNNGFDQILEKLMHEAGKAEEHFKMSVAEVQVRDDGLLFITRGGQTRFECRCFHSPTLALTVIDPEEFISKIECTGEHIVLVMNTGRVAGLAGQVDQSFGPWNAPSGFHIVGLRTKPSEVHGKARIPAYREEVTAADRVVGLTLSPLPKAHSYDVAASLRFASEKEHLLAMRDLLSRGGVNVNTFGEGGVTSLMLAAQNGNIGSMRLLLNSKAKINIADDERWTALTYASKFGQTSAVQLLLDRGATKEGDDGAALREAVRYKHNSAARALLRAGFGSAPCGTFALEKVTNTGTCSLNAPEISPAGGAFASPVVVHLHCNKVPKSSVRILYTTDGRDPSEAGRLYKDPLTIVGPRTRVRAIAVGEGQQSAHVDALYFVCNYVLPYEVVSGTLNVSTIPEGKAILRSKLAALLNAPAERVVVEATSKTQTSNEGKWLRVPVRNPRPKHRLIFNVKHVTVRKADKANQFINKITRDMLNKHGCGEKPEHVTLSAHKKNTAMDFTLTRVAADELVRQLRDPNSYFCSQARWHSYWCTATYETVDLLGDHVMQPALYTYLTQLLGKAISTEHIVGVGQGDTGTLGFKARKSTNKLKKSIAKAIKDSLPQAEQEDMRESPADLQFDYVVDVVRNQMTNDGSTVAQCLGSESFPERFSQELAEVLHTKVAAEKEATSRELHRLRFNLSWKLPQPGRGTTEAGPIQGFLDAFCVVYADSKLQHLIDLCGEAHHHKHDHNHNWESSDRGSEQMRCDITRAIWPGGDNASEASSTVRMCELDLHTLPREVTDIYFVLSSGPADSLAPFPHLTMSLSDAVTGRELSGFSTSCDHAHAMVMCVLSHPPGSSTWMLHHLMTASDGGLRHFEPIYKAVQQRQAIYERWHRKNHLIKLRILKQLKWISRHSSSEFASFVWAVLDLPATCFQALCNMF